MSLFESALLAGCILALVALALVRGRQNTKPEEHKASRVGVEQEINPEDGDRTTAGIDLSAIAGLQVPGEGDRSAQHGIKAFMRRDYQQAAQILPPHAEAGHLKSQTILAKMYFSGHGVEKDQERYRYWLERAADNGHKPSKAKLKKLRRRS